MNRQKQIENKKAKLSDKKPRRRSRIKQSQPYPIDNNLFNKFQKFKSQQRNKILKKKLYNYFGRNFIGQYLPSFNVLQQWQDNKLHKNHRQFNILQQNQSYYLIFSFILMIVNIFTLWTISVERYFNTKQISQQTQIYFVQLLFLAIKMTANIVIQNKKNIDQSFNLRLVINKNKANILCISYCLFMSFTDTSFFPIYILELIVIVILFKTSASIYQNMKIMDYGLKYQNQIKILNLFSNILIQAHLFALILYTASKIDMDENWIKSNQLIDKSPLSKYIYSFYFASTTMLTIGYGDITPVNIYQIMINVLIQMVGVISFGYLVNQMGHTLSKIRKSTEELQRDLQTINKISKFYNLEKDLENKAKSFVISNQNRTEQLKLEDEDNLLMKLSEDLRQKINHENSLSVVKSSIFFLCNWTKNMQSLIAQKLKKHIFAPNEKINFPNGIQRMFIIKVGKIEILMNKYNNVDQYKKVLKVIDSQKNQQVSDNIYGYTSIFSNRKVLLQGIAKQFTATYSVDKNEFLECIKQNKKDFQYYHEIKCRIDQSFHCQQFQTPSIANIRQHYSPSVYIVIKKSNKNLRQCKNSRKVGKKRKTYKKCKLLMNFKIKDSNPIDDLLPQRFSTEKTIQFTENKISSIVGLDMIQQQSSSSSFEHTFQNKTTLRLGTSFSQSEFLFKKERLKFEQYCQYSNYYKNHNISQVLFQLQVQNYMQKKLN